MEDRRPDRQGQGDLGRGPLVASRAQDCPQVQGRTLKAHVEVESETALVTDCDRGSGIASDAAAAPGLIDDDP
jgi:hypothetical protein